MTTEILAPVQATTGDRVAISIVICTIERSGREERLAEVIRKLQAQEKVDLEIVLVWQGFDPALFPRFDGVTTVITDLCSSADSRNIGADHTRHGLIAFYDDDVYPIEPDQLWRTARMMLGEGRGRLYLEFLAESGDDDFAARHQVHAVRPATVVAELEAAGATLVHRELRRQGGPTSSEICRIIARWDPTSPTTKEAHG